MINTDCPFCSPHVDKSVFAYTKNFRAIYNLAPILPGHTLIIPYRHINRFLDVEDELMLEMIQFSRKVIQTISQAFNNLSYDWTIQEGLAAGQTVAHMHIHIIPRHEGDLASPGDWYPRLKKQEANMTDSLSRPKLSDNQMKAIITQLSQIYRDSYS